MNEGWIEMLRAALEKADILTPGVIIIYELLPYLFSLACMSYIHYTNVSHTHNKGSKKFFNNGHM